MTNKVTETDRMNYSNRKKLNTDFSKKNLKRSNCFSSNFSGSNFDDTNFKGAQFKNCNFTDCHFEATEFVATNLRNSKFVNAHFKNSIFEVCNLDGVNFENATFDNVIFVQTDLSKVLNLDLSSNGIRNFEAPIELELSQKLERAIKSCKKNEFVKAAGVLDTKDGTINLTSVMILLENFTEEILLNHLGKLKVSVDESFGTLSYLIHKIKAAETEA